LKQVSEPKINFQKFIKIFYFIFFQILEEKVVRKSFGGVFFSRKKEWLLGIFILNKTFLGNLSKLSVSLVLNKEWQVFLLDFNK